MVSRTSIAVRGLAGLLAIASLALSARAGPALDVRVDAGLVSIAADDVPLHDVLEALVAQGALRLIAFRAVDRTVTVRLHRVPLADAIQRLLGEFESYQLFSPAAVDGKTTGSETPTLWLFDDGSDPALVLDFYASVLDHGGIGDRKEAIRALRDIATPAALRLLAAALDDPDARVRRAARHALAAVGDAEALAMLDAELDAPDPARRTDTIDVLSDMDDTAARARIAVALADADPQVRAAAVSGLADSADEWSRALLVEALDDRDAGVREAAADALDAIDDDALFRALFPDPQAAENAAMPANLR